jgi:hypothetical protein
MKMRGMSPEVIDYLVKRGCATDGDFIIIPHRCQHLRLDEKLSVYDIDPVEKLKLLKTPKYKCDIHYQEDYPVICRRFHGHGRYYIPEGCVYMDEKQMTLEDELLAKSLKRHIKSMAEG